MRSLSLLATAVVFFSGGMCAPDEATPGESTPSIALESSPIVALPDCRVTGTAQIRLAIGSLEELSVGPGTIAFRDESGVHLSRRAADASETWRATLVASAAEGAPRVGSVSRGPSGFLVALISPTSGRLVPVREDGGMEDAIVFAEDRVDEAELASVGAQAWVHYRSGETWRVAHVDVGDRALRHTWELDAPEGEATPMIAASAQMVVVGWVRDEAPWASPPPPIVVLDPGSDTPPERRELSGAGVGLVGGEALRAIFESSDRTGLWMQPIDVGAAVRLTHPDVRPEDVDVTTFGGVSDGVSDGGSHGGLLVSYRARGDAWLQRIGPDGARIGSAIVTGALSEHAQIGAIGAEVIVGSRAGRQVSVWVGQCGTAN